MGLASNHYPPDQLLERAGIQFLNSRAFEAAIGIFALLSDRQPHNANLWYGLGNAFSSLSFTSEKPRHLELSVSTLKRSLQEDSSNKFSLQLIGLVAGRARTDGLNPDNIKPFADQSQILLDAVEFSSQTLIEAIHRFEDWHERMGMMMFLGEQPDKLFLPVLIDGVENDSHNDVKLAAIKRLALHASYPETQACFEVLFQRGMWKELEPYMSMALSRIQYSWAKSLLQKMKP